MKSPCKGCWNEHGPKGKQCGYVKGETKDTAVSCAESCDRLRKFQLQLGLIPSFNETQVQCVSSFKWNGVWQGLPV